MELVASLEILELYWLADVKAAYGIWRPGVYTPKQAASVFDEVQRLLTSRRGTSWISDGTLATISSQETQDLARVRLAEMVRLGVLARWATIPPASATSRLMVGGLAANARANGIPFAQFASFDAACAWIAQEQGLTSALKSAAR